MLLLNGITKAIPLKSKNMVYTNSLSLFLRIG